MRRSTNPASGDIAVGRQVRLIRWHRCFVLPCNPATVTSGGATITSTTYAALPNLHRRQPIPAHGFHDRMAGAVRATPIPTPQWEADHATVCIEMAYSRSPQATGTCNPPIRVAYRCAAPVSGVTNKYLAALPSGDTWTVTAGFTQFCTAAFCGFSFGFPTAGNRNTERDVGHEQQQPGV